MRVIDLDSGLVLRQGPLDLVSDSRIDGNKALALAKADDGEVAAGELDAAVLVDEVEDGAGDLDEDLFGGDRRRGGAGVVREEVFDEVADLVDFGIERGGMVRRTCFGL